MVTTANRLKIVAVAVAVISCGPESADDVDRALTSLLQTQSSQIKLSEITTFPWERVCIARPYSTAESISSAAGVESGIVPVPHGTSDLLIFVHENDVRAYVQRDRRDGGFETLQGVNCFNRDQAVFRSAIDSTTGATYLQPLP